MSYTYAQKARKILRIAVPSGANSLLDIIMLALGMFFMGKFGEEYLVAFIGEYAVCNALFCHQCGVLYRHKCTNL